MYRKVFGGGGGADLLSVLTTFSLIPLLRENARQWGTGCRCEESEAKQRRRRSESGQSSTSRSRRLSSLSIRPLPYSLGAKALATPLTRMRAEQVLQGGPRATTIRRGCDPGPGEAWSEFRMGRGGACIPQKKESTMGRILNT